MRILFLIHSLRKGGAERLSLELAAGLCARGNDARVVAWLDVDDYPEERYRGVRRESFIPAGEYSWPWGIPRAASALRTVVERFRPDAVEIHTPTMALVAAWARLRVPATHVLQGYSAMARERAGGRDVAAMWLARLADRRLHPHFIVPTQGLRDAGMKYFAAGAERFSVIPHGVDPDAIPIAARTTPTAARLVMVGTLMPAKGQLWGIRAMKDLVARLPGTQLVLVGEGGYRQVLEREIVSLGLGGCVQLLGRSHNVFEILRSSDVFWHLSESEGLPMAVLEAMAAGLPVVGFDVRGTRDAVSNGETGVLVQFGDIAGVVDATIDILTNRDRYSTLARSARTAIESRFRLSETVASHEELLERLARQGAGLRRSSRTGTSMKPE